MPTGSGASGAVSSRIAAPFSLGAGVRHVGKTRGDSKNTIRVDSYTLADLSARYEWDEYAATLTVNNVFDKQYYAICGTGAGCALGEERKATMSLGLKF